MLQKLHEDLKIAMKNKETTKKEVIKMILTICTVKEKEKNRNGAVTNDEIIEIIKSQLKQTTEAIADFEKGGRIDLVEQANAEIEILKSYLPAQLSEDEIAEIVKNKIDELSLDPKNINIIMKNVMPVVGQRSNGNIVRKVIQDLIKG